MPDPSRRAPAPAPASAHRRDRHGRGLRGPLVPPHLPAWRTRAERFDELVETGQMLEWALVHGVNRYGTPRGPVDDAAARGRIPVLELDLAGARQVRRSMPEAAQIFIAPPAWEELERRLRGRGTESPEEIARRLETAREEMAAMEEFDVVVVNDSVSRATEELLRIFGITR